MSQSSDELSQKGLKKIFLFLEKEKNSRKGHYPSTK